MKGLTEMSENASSLTSAASLPEPAVYESEYEYWPWGRLIEQVAGRVTTLAPLDATVFDYMCGTGYLLSRIANDRPDLKCAGCDIHLPFVTYGKEKYLNIDIRHADARVTGPPAPADVVLCTSGLHHVPFEEQSLILAKMASECSPDGVAFIGEEMLGPVQSERDRLRASILLNSELIRMAVRDSWPASSVDAALMILHNDVLCDGEYKRDKQAWRTLIEESFVVNEIIDTWVAEAGGGDAIFLCRPRGLRLDRRPDALS